MASNHNPLSRIKGTAKGVAYTGVVSQWKCHFGTVIVIAENYEALEIASRKLEELKVHEVFKPALCPQVAVFQLTDVEASHVVP